jgi:hypothetical protein
MPTTQPNAARRYARITSDTRRLAAVRATGLPEGRGPRDRFERLAAVAARLLDAPVAIVSLVDADRDVWVGLSGVPAELAAAGGTSVRPSFCQAIIASTRDVLAISDARTSSLFATFPAVQLLGVVACLGVPLITRAGHALGSCCVYDMKPRNWTPHDIENLTALGAGAVAEMERLAAVGVADETSDAVVRYLGAAIDTIETFIRVMPGQCDTSRIARVTRTAAVVARQFSTLARPLHLADGSVDLAVTTHETWRLLQIVAGEEASVTLDFPDGLPKVTISHTRAVRLLVTHIAGARDALHGRGWIQVAAECDAPGMMRLTVRAVNASAPLGVPFFGGAISAADQLLRVCGGQVTTHDDTVAVALLRTADSGRDRLE